jgi:hypothetical protein
MRHLVFFDTETYRKKCEYDIEIQTLKLGVACYCRMDTKNYFQRWITFTIDKEFYEFIESCVRKNTTLYVFAHNISFDLPISNIIRNLLDNGWTEKFVSLNHRQIILKFRKDKKSICFLDTYNFLPFSVETLGNKIGLEKLKIDFDTCTDEELKTYCKRDVEIIAIAMKNFMDFIKKNDLGSIGLTLAQQAWKTFRHKFMKHKIYIHNHENALKLENEAYFGGRNEAFFIGEKKGKFYKLDVNSMYPYVMRNYDYPTKLVGYIKEDVDIDRVKEILNKYCVIARCILNTSEPTFPKKINRKLVFVEGFLETVLCTEALKYAIEKGYVTRIKEIAVYEKARIFEDYVDYFYNLRQKAKENNDRVTDLMSKLLLNSLYGKFGQRVRETLVWDIEYVTLEDGTILDYVVLEDKRYTVYRWFDKAYLISTSEESSYEAFPAIAAHVTDYARMYLWSFIKMCVDNNDYYKRTHVFYIDTDSLIVDHEGFRRLESFLDSNELGKLKLEVEADYLCIFGLKDYILGDEVKTKGIKKNAIKVKDKCFIQPVFPCLSKVLKTNQEGFLIIKNVTKELRRIYNKGHVLKDGTVVPLRIFNMINIQGKLEVASPM